MENQKKRDRENRNISKNRKNKKRNVFAWQRHDMVSDGLSNNISCVEAKKYINLNEILETCVPIDYSQKIEIAYTGLVLVYQKALHEINVSKEREKKTVFFVTTKKIVNLSKSWIKHQKPFNTLCD